MPPVLHDNTNQQDEQDAYDAAMAAKPAEARASMVRAAFDLMRSKEGNQ